MDSEFYHMNEYPETLTDYCSIIILGKLFFSALKAELMF